MKSVTNNGWNVSTTIGSDIKGAKLSVFKVISHNPWKIRRGDADGKVFNDCDEASKFCLERGYTVAYSRADYFAKVSKEIAEMRMSHGRRIGQMRINKMKDSANVG